MKHPTDVTIIRIPFARMVSENAEGLAREWRGYLQAGDRKFVIDFQGPPFAGLGRDDGVELVVTPSRGKLGTAYNHPVVDQRERWRAVFDLEAQGPEPVDIRAYLRRNGRALTETWIYQYFPED